MVLARKSYCDTAIRSFVTQDVLLARRRRRTFQNLFYQHAIDVPYPLSAEAAYYNFNYLRRASQRSQLKSSDRAVVCPVLAVPLLSQSSLTIELNRPTSTIKNYG